MTKPYNIAFIDGQNLHYLIKKDLLKKIIFPNGKHSSLYNKLSNKFYYYLKDAKLKIEYNKKRGS